MNWLRYSHLLFVILFSISLSTPCLADTPAKGKMSGAKVSHFPAWFKESFLDITEDVAEANEAGKHVILFMHINGCPYCYKMAEENFKQAPYTPFIKENFDVIEINIRGDREVALNQDTSLTEKELAQKWNIVYTPTLIFLNSNNQTVARVNGYRSIADFKYVLDYVYEKAYQKTSLAKYIDAKKEERYTFRDHPQLTTATNFQSVASRPLALLFEDKGCHDCNALHDGHLSDPRVREVLKNYTLVRLDALSNEKIIDVNGNSTTPQAYAETLGLTYRPALILFDNGKEIMRIQSMLYRFHFTEILRYVGEGHYKKYPDSFYDYLDVRTAELLDSGQDVNISE